MDPNDIFSMFFGGGGGFAGARSGSFSGPNVSFRFG